MTAPKTGADWERIRSQYRTNTISVREIAAQHGVSHTAINKRARSEGWPRDRRAEVQAKAAEKVSKALVSSEVSTGNQVSDSQAVEIEAEVQARVQIAQRTDIGRARRLAMSLLDELELHTTQPELYEKLLELVNAPTGEDDVVDKAVKQSRRDALQRAMSLGNRTTTMKALAETLKTLVQLERVAFGIGEDGRGSGRSDFEKMLEEVSGLIER